MGKDSSLHKKIEGIIFDMDGTIFDTERLSYNIWINLFNEYHLLPNTEFFLGIRGRNINDSKEIFKKYYPNSRYSYLELKEEKNQRLLDYVANNGVPIKKGFFTLIKFLKAKGIKMALATSSSKNYASYLLNKANVYKVFDVLVFGDEVKHSKPDPEIFNIAASKLNINKENILVIEDSKHGINAALNGNFKCVWIPDGIYFDVPSSIYKLDSLDEIKKLI